MNNGWWGRAGAWGWSWGGFQVGVKVRVTARVRARSGSGFKVEARVPPRAQPQCTHRILVWHTHGLQHRRHTRGVGMAGGSWVAMVGLWVVW